ncbi:MAG: cadherin repeat domain-containing protein, partial [Campylobacterota bacterium]|nr:cadherin repeat domain-containing protein [Campylobacterota bacterium]
MRQLFIIITLLILGSVSGFGQNSKSCHIKKKVHNISYCFTVISDSQLPHFISPNEITVLENQTAAITIAATDESLPVTLLLETDGDAALFTFESSTGTLTFKTAPNYESSADSNSDNTYEVIIKAIDNIGLESFQTLNIHVKNVADVTPIISGTTFSIDENSSAQIGAVPILKSGDSNISAFTLSGDDNSSFSVDAQGVITLRPNTILDYTVKPIYQFQVVAINDAGDSNIAVITVKINKPIVTELSFTLDAFEMPLDATMAFTAVASYNNGKSTNVISEVLLIADNTSIIQVDANNTIKALAEGSSNLHVEFEGV